MQLVITEMAEIEGDKMVARIVIVKKSTCDGNEIAPFRRRQSLGSGDAEGVMAIPYHGNEIGRTEATRVRTFVRGTG
jgi:hypothetical protein